MPIYEYQCASCGAVTDIKHGFKETTNETCPSCEGELKRLFNPAGIVFKGSGFYVTDSRKSGDGSSKGESGGSESSKSESSKGETSKGESSKGESSKSESSKSEGSKSGSGGTGDAAA